MKKPFLPVTNSASESSSCDAIAINAENPWLDMQGNAIDDVRLKVICKAWNPEMWERYLSWLDTPRKESLVSRRTYADACDEQVQSIFENAQSDADDETKARVAKYLTELTEQQRRVIHMLFWESKSERDIARQLKISQVSVHNLKTRAIKKLSRLLEGAIVFRIMRGQVAKTPTAVIKDQSVFAQTPKSKAG